MKYIPAILCCLLSSFLFSQENGKSNWSVTYQKSRSFIENKGQFNAFETVETGPIRFAFDFGSTRVFFGTKGLGYSFLEAEKIPKAQREAYEATLRRTVQEHKRFEKMVGKFKYKGDWLTMQWEGMNSACQLLAVNESSDYHNYSYSGSEGTLVGVDHARAYQKLIYKNCYPGIDIEYTIHPEVGIKYALIVQPNANPTLISMAYDRDVLLKNGEVHVPTSFGDMVDHSPLSFIAGDTSSVVRSSFVQSGNHISFEVGSYDSTKTLVIDPWVQTPAFATNWDVVWECERDAAGNTYVLGGIMPMQVLKYSSTGTLLWTYNTPYDTSNCWLGTLATDLAGNSYVTRGSVSGIQKISSGGALVWNNNGGGGSIGNSDEYWSIAFNCDQTGLVIGGTSGAFALPPLLEASIFNMNTGNGNISNTVDVAVGPSFSIPPNVQEVRSIAAAPNGKYYFLTQDTIGFISDNFNLCTGNSSDLFKINNGIDLGYKCEDFRYDNTGICALAADATALFVNKGNQLQKRSLSNLSVLGTVNIPNGGFASQGLGINALSNSGIAVDDCGNIYVGSTDGVYKFNNALVQQAFYPTAFKVYDVEVNLSGEIIACGGTGNSSSGSRSGGIQSFAASACVPIASTCCDASICIPSTFCSNDAPVTLTTATSGGTWSGNGVSASGVFNPSLAGVGSHTITYTLPCGSESITILVSSCQSMQVCEETNGNFTVTGGVGPYSWAQFVPASNTPITNQTQCEACGYTWNPGFPPFLPAQCLNNLLQPVTTCSSPSSYATFTTGNSVAVPPGVTNVQITDASGTVITVDLTTVLPCGTVPCPTINLTTSSQTNVNCFGVSNGAATVSAVGGTGPYSFTWSPGNLTGASQVNLAAGTYTVSILDANNCPGSGTVNISQPSALAVSTTATATTCTAFTGVASTTVTGGSAPYAYLWNPGGSTSSSINNLSSGNYTVTVTDANNCQAISTVNVPSTNGPSISLLSSSNVSCAGGMDGQASVTVAGGSGTLSVQWIPGNLNGTSQNNLSAGTYQVTVTDASGCSNALSITIEEPIPISISQGVIVPATCGVNDGSASVLVTGGTIPLSYAWSPSGGNAALASNLGAGSYNIIVTDANNCTDNVTLIVPNANGPVVSIVGVTDVSCMGATDGSALASVNGGNPPYTYNWLPSGGTNSTATNLAEGTYSVLVTDIQGCVGTASALIGSPLPIVINESILPTSCDASTGQISVSVSGGTPGYVYNWQPSNGSGSSITNLAVGNYTLTVTDAAGCSQTENYTMTASGTIPITVSPYSVTIFEGQSVTLTANGASDYFWEPPYALSCDTCGITVANPDLTTIYTVTGTDENGCTGTAEVLVNVQKICGDFYVPTVFAPDGNGSSENTKVCVYGTCISSFEYNVYNRWGQLVFKTNEQNNCWDGTFKGSPQHAGVYAYTLYITLDNGDYLEQSGNLTLIR